MTRARGLAVLLLALLVLPSTLRAQKLTLLITSGSPVAFPTPTSTDYDNTFVAATAPLVFSLDLLGGGGGGVARTGSLSIRSTASVMGGTKPIGDLEWSRADLGVWNAMTTSNVLVQSKPMTRNTVNDPWGNSLLFRVRLNWANDGPATYTPTIVLVVTLTTP